MTHVTITHEGIEYSATVDRGAVSIRRDGVWIGKGTWHVTYRQVEEEDCAALPARAWVALDLAIAAAMDKAA